MVLDWHKVWLEFDEMFDKALQKGMSNTWSNQQKIIQRVIERNLTQRAADVVYCGCDNPWLQYETGACGNCLGEFPPR